MNLKKTNTSNPKELFGSDFEPAVNLSLSEVSQKAQQMAGKLSISGMQPKLSLRLNRRSKELEIVAEKGEYILKPQNPAFPHIPENEYTCMKIARRIGIEVPPHGLIRLKDDSLAYIVKRFDRRKEQKIHQEDFFQILNKKDKYEGSLEEIGKKLKIVSDVPGLDVQRLYERVVFFFIIGNGDAHLKNYSVLYHENGQIRLSPAYDIVSSKLVIPDEEDAALSINGRKNKITKKDFIQFAEFLDIPKAIGEYFYLDKKELIINLVRTSYLPDEEKEKLTSIVEKRFQRLA